MGRKFDLMAAHIYREARALSACDGRGWEDLSLSERLGYIEEASEIAADLYGVAALPLRFRSYLPDGMV